MPVDALVVAAARESLIVPASVPTCPAAETPVRPIAMVLAVDPVAAVRVAADRDPVTVGTKAPVAAVVVAAGIETVTVGEKLPVARDAVAAASVSDTEDENDPVAVVAVADGDRTVTVSVKVPSARVAVAAGIDAVTAGEKLPTPVDADVLELTETTFCNVPSESVAETPVSAALPLMFAESNGTRRRRTI